MMIPGTQDLQLIVELSDPGVLERMSANSTPLTGAGRLSERNRQIDLQSQQALAYRQQVSQNKEAIKSRILQFPGAQVQGTTEVVMNTVIVRVRASDYNSIRKLPGVKKVYFSRPRKMLLDQAAIIQNASVLWNAANGTRATAGQGIKIGLIDSGIDITNPMFSGSGMTAPSGFPKLVSRKYGTQTDKAYTNSKVIVARSYVRCWLILRTLIQTAKDEVGTWNIRCRMCGRATSYHSGEHHHFGNGARRVSRQLQGFRNSKLSTAPPTRRRSSRRSMMQLPTAWM